MKLSNYLRIITHVPRESLEEVQKAIGDVGAGVMGNYTYCSFVLPGIGYFIPGEGAHPTIGNIGISEQVEEYHLETTCLREILPQVIETLKKAHPYEEVPIFIHEMWEV